MGAGSLVTLVQGQGSCASFSSKAKERVWDVVGSSDQSDLWFSAEASVRGALLFLALMGELARKGGKAAATLQYIH